MDIRSDDLHNLINAQIEHIDFLMNLISTNRSLSLSMINTFVCTLETHKLDPKDLEFYNKAILELQISLNDGKDKESDLKEIRAQFETMSDRLNKETLLKALNSIEEKQSEIYQIELNLASYTPKILNRINANLFELNKKNDNSKNITTNTSYNNNTEEKASDIHTNNSEKNYENINNLETPKFIPYIDIPEIKDIDKDDILGQVYLDKLRKSKINAENSSNTEDDETKNNINNMPNLDPQKEKEDSNNNINNTTEIDDNNDVSNINDITNIDNKNSEIEEEIIGKSISSNSLDNTNPIDAIPINKTNEINSKIQEPIQVQKENVLQNGTNVITDNSTIRDLESNQEKSAENTHEVPTFTPKHEKAVFNQPEDNEGFFETNKNTNSLIISEVSGKVKLPFSNDIVDILDFKNPVRSRFIEGYRLSRDREHEGPLLSFEIALRLCFKSKIHPAIIRACRNFDDLDTYLYYLNTDAVESYPNFKIVFQTHPYKKYT